MANFFSQLIGKGRGDSGRTQRYMQKAYENLGSSGQIGYRGDGVYDYSQALNGVQFDQFGFTNQLPADLIAPEVQLRANQIAAQRNDRLLTEGTANAQLALRSGLGNLASYRPGGAAALLSPYYQQMASTYFQGAVARQQEAPDLMYRADERRQKRAEAQAKQAGLVNAIGTVAAVAAAPFTGGASLAALPALSQLGGSATPGGGGAPAPQSNPGSTTNPNLYPSPIGPPTAQQAGGQAPQIGPPTAQQAQGAGSGQQFTGGQKQLAPGAVNGPTGGGQGPQAAPGGGGGGAGPSASGGPKTGPGAAPAGPVSGAPVGPATQSLADASGGSANAPLFSALLRRAFSTQPNIAHEFQARLSFIMARDIPLSA